MNVFTDIPEGYTGNFHIYQNPELDKMECIVFPKSPKTMVIQVEKGCTPNWFHRKMQELTFGVKWKERD